MLNQSYKTGLRIQELDGLRGLAVGMVLIWHFIGCMIDGNLGIWARALHYITVLGRTGVDLFFVLSGFFITGIVLDRSNGNKVFLQSFYIRRALRIVPSYIILVLIFWFLVALGVRNHAFNNETPLLYHLTLSQNWWMCVNKMWGPAAISTTWSVAIEEQFYLIFPLILLTAPRNNMPKIFIAIAFLSACIRFLAIIFFDNIFLMYVSTLSRLDGLAAGALVAHLWRHPSFGEWIKDLRKVAYLKKIIILFLAIMPVFLIAVNYNLKLTMAVWGHSYLTLFYASLMFWVIYRLSEGRGGVPAFRTTWLRELGGISYTIYLFHPIFLSIAFFLAGRPERISTLSDCALAIAALLATLLYSKISLKRFERPFVEFGRKFPY